MKKTFGLIGFPLTHSFSKKYFTDKFSREKKAEYYSYENYELKDLAEFPELIKRHSTLSGLNITIPYKEKIIPFLDELKGYAMPVKAVNTVMVHRNLNGAVVKTTGYNTDVTGFYETIQPLLLSHHSGALVLGTGGASKAVIYALQLLKISSQQVSRNKNLPGTISYDEITRPILDRFPVIINTTPLGSFPDIHSFPHIPYELLGPQNLLYDLVYNPPETRFLAQGRAQGAKTFNGYAMLIAQAEAAWQIWNTSK